MYYKLKIPARLASFSFTDALNLLEEMRKSLIAQGEGKIPGFPPTQFESHNRAAIDKVVEEMKNEGGYEGRYLTRQYLCLHMVSLKRVFPSRIKSRSKTIASLISTIKGGLYSK